MDDYNQVFIKEDNQIVFLLKELAQLKKKVVLYGAGYCGLETYHLMNRYHISVIAICDDSNEVVGKKMGDVNICHIEDITPDKDMVIFITSGFNRKMKEKLHKLDLSTYYIETDFGRYEEDKENLAYFEEHKNDIEKVFQLLDDDKSKFIYKRLIQFRISRNLKHLQNIENGIQYFPNDLFELGNKEIFLDLGAFNGDTIEAFCNHVNGKYREVIAIEASNNNYKNLVKNTKNLKNIVCYNVAVGGTSEIKRFYVSDAKNSFMSENGTEEIQVERIDNILMNQNVTFVKLDIEGAEYEAICGAESLIRRSRPILAISLYHKVDDLFKIPLLMTNMVSDYCYYIRHYSPTVIETVLYAIPIEKVKGK